MENLRLCLVQMSLAWENPAENRATIEQMLAGEEGRHDLVVLPEMFTTGFSMKAAELAEPPGGETEQWMHSMAVRLGAVIMGSIIVEDGGHYYNRLLVVHKGGTAMSYDKRHLFRLAGEHEVYQAGAEIQVFTVRGWRILPLICYDLRFPVWSRNKRQDDGRLYFDLMIYVANWPERRAFHWKTLLQARAIENQSYVAGLNRVGTDGNDITYTGDSALIDPLGMHLLTAANHPNLLAMSLEWESLASYRERFPAWADADKFDVYA